ncbi:MBL fold metallo-hydrolase [Aliikangiella maris]|uniref:MBL fold metallo-hydrolase n=2 Tax=Aliikangiella maris TaxID=3162458 RepID=A0ABV2BW19_9GAMM
MPTQIESFFHQETSSFTYLVYDISSKEAVLIDPVADFDLFSGKISYQSAEMIFSQIEAQQLKLKWILETHAHADHITASQWFKAKTNALILIGARITTVQQTFNQLFNLTSIHAATAEDFDQLLADKQVITIGNTPIKCIYTPGHTPSCSTYLIDNHAFVGDTLFMPDYGTARCDFPGGDAGTLYDSIKTIFALPEETHLYMCHDYQPGDRELLWQTTVKEQKIHNIHIGNNRTRSDFINLRQERDKQLKVPKLLLSALQINIRAGKLPIAENNNHQYLKIPINQI